MAIAAWLAASSPPAVLADFQQGLDAFRRQDFHLAHEQWLACARAGAAPCQYALGVLLDEGRGAPPDHSAAVRWLRRAADQDYTDAMMQLGFLYAVGRDGVAQDPVRSWVWFARAATLGAPQAAAHRDRVAEFLSAEERREAERLADELSIRYHLQE